MNVNKSVQILIARQPIIPINNRDLLEIKHSYYPSTNI
ncbi:hypothetical protein SZ39_2200 [Bacillus mycoides]|nr:hypothetical protein SZ39_2200 [Bacillus mycoides]